MRSLTDDERQLVADNASLLRRAVRGWVVLGCEHADLLQIASLGLMRAATIYRRELGSFKPIALLCMWSALNTERLAQLASCRFRPRFDPRKQNRKSWRCLKTLEREDGSIGSVGWADPSVLPVMNDPTEAPERRDLIAWAMPQLTAREQDIVLSCAAGEQQQDIAKRLGVHPSRVTQIRTEIAAKLAKAA